MFEVRIPKHKKHKLITYGNSGGFLCTKLFFILVACSYTVRASGVEEWPVPCPETCCKLRAHRKMGIDAL
jgi:hypothetical protein